MKLGIGRPYLNRDPPHVGPIDGKEFADKRGITKANPAGLAMDSRHPVAVGDNNNKGVTKASQKQSRREWEASNPALKTHFPNVAAASARDLHRSRLRFAGSSC
jgi:hypothetical protein